MRTTQRRWRLSATLLLLPLFAAAAIGLAACGSGDDDGDGARAQTASGATGDAAAMDTQQGGDAGAGSAADPAPVGDRGQIRRLLDEAQAAYIAGDGSGYCEMLTASGQEQIVRFAKAYGVADTCEQFIATTSQATKNAGIKQKPTKILAIKLDGDRARATVSDGGRPPQPFAFVKQEGVWKIPDPGFDDIFDQKRPNQQQTP